MAEEGWDKVVGLDLVSMKEFGVYSGGSREPVNGFGEGSDIQIPF